jgi:membrane-associated protein
VDVVAGLEAVVHSAWLLPALVLMIAVDGPVPMLPSETLLMTAAAVAFAEGDAGMLGGLFAAAVVGSLAGDLLTYGLGRSSNRLIAGSSTGSCASWVRRHLLDRPGPVLVGARFVPGGRLVSTAAAGRFGLALRRFVPWSLASSAAWAAYMLVVGRVLEPMTGGDPVLCVAGAAALAVLTAAVFAIGRRLVRRRTTVTV